ncbi:ribonuclease H-like domain-containing protein [Tanacetum coccineum]
MSTHPMVTRAKAGIFKPLERMNCHVTTTSPLPRSHVHALRDPNWKEAMLDEYNALITNGTWVLVPCPVNVNVVRSMWLFKHKFNADGSLNKYKARFIANGRSQQQGIDCDETFSLVVKPATIRTIFSLVVSCDWPIHQLDVKNVFLYGYLSETRIIASLHSEFAMTDFGSLNYFLGISAQRSASGLFLSQSKFAEEILERAHMQNYNPCRTPVDTESNLGSGGEPINDPILYRSLVGALQYLTFTRLDLSYVVQQVCLYMHDPHDSHFTALKRILRHVRGTLDYGLQLHVSSTTQLTAYADTDWAGCPVILSRSSAKAEYQGVAKTAWIRNLLRELHTPLCTATLVYCDNVSAVYMSANPVQH